MIDRLKSPFKRIVEEAPITRLLFPFIVGILLAEIEDSASSMILPLALASVISLSIAIYCHLVKRKKRKAYNILFSFAIGFACIDIGFLCTLIQKDNNIILPKQEQSWRGVIVESPKQTEKTWRFTMMLDSEGNNQKVVVSVMKNALDSMPHIGNAIEFRGEMKEPYNYMPKANKKDSASNSKVNSTQNNKPPFDYAKWLKRQGVSGQGFTFRPINILSDAEADKIISQQSTLTQLKIKALAWRNNLIENYKILNLTDEESSILAALTLGDKSNISQQTRDTFSISGASHVLALSGLHLGILVSVLILLFKPLRIKRWSQWLMIAICLGLIWTFVILTGCSISIVRSAFMLSLMLLLGMRGEGFSSLNNVALAAFIILLFNPQGVLDLSFQLSFISVVFIIYFLPYYKEFIPRHKHAWQRYILDFIFITIVAQMATAPIVAYTFGRLPLMFILTNLLVIPCAYILLIGSMLFLLLSWISPIASLLGAIITLALKALTGGLHWISTLPLASIELHPTLVSTWLIYPLIFTIIAFAIFRKRNYMYWSILLLGIIISFECWF